MEVLAQVRRRPETAALGDLVDARVAALERGAGGIHALGEQPAQDGQAGLGGEAAREGALRDVGVGGEAAHRQRLVQALECPGARRRQRAARLRGDRPVDVLGLAAVAMRRDDDAAGDPVGQRGAVVAAQDVQAEIDPRGDARRGEDVALVDVEHPRLDADARMAGGEIGRVAPVGRRAATVEHARRGEREGAGADRDHARAARVGGAQRVEHARVGRAQMRRETRDEHGVR